MTRPRQMPLKCGKMAFSGDRPSRFPLAIVSRGKFAVQHMGGVPAQANGRKSDSQPGIPSANHQRGRERNA